MPGQKHMQHEKQENLSAAQNAESTTLMNPIKMAYMKLRHMMQKNDYKCGQNDIKRTPVLPKRKKCPGE